MHFAAALPAWCGSDGLPLSYRHFVYGLAFLGRHQLRDQLAAAQAFRVAQFPADDFVEWQGDLVRLTEVPR
jgi:hypothetical protein